MFAAIIMGIMMNSINVNDGIVINNHEVLSSNDISIINEYIEKEGIDNATLVSFEDTEKGFKFVIKFEDSEDATENRIVNYNDGIELFGKTFFDGFETTKTTCRNTEFRYEW